MDTARASVIVAACIFVMQLTATHAFSMELVSKNRQISNARILDWLDGIME
ncbi:hypothetical protein [Desulfoplanes sp.]